MWWDNTYNPKENQAGHTPEELVENWIADTVFRCKLYKDIPYTGPNKIRPGILYIKGNIDRGLDIFRKFILFLYANGQYFDVEPERENYSSTFRHGVRSIAYVYEQPFGIKLVEKKIPKEKLLKEKDKPHPLKFQMELNAWVYDHKTFGETKSLSMEDRFEEILNWMKESATEAIEWKERQKKIDEERAAQKKAQKEHEAMIIERAGYAYSIRNAIKRIEKATTIRQFCERLEKEEISHKGSISERTLTKIEVALSLADWIDPFVDHVDEILAEKYKPEDFV